MDYFVTPQDFGAKGNGWTDDTGAYKEPPDYLVEIQNFLGEKFPEKSAKILLMHEMYKK